MYHKADALPPGARYPGNYVLPEAFEEQIACLAKWKYQSITFDEWLSYREGKGKLPKRPVIITFDDGYRSTYEIAWPILRRWGFSATVFLVSKLIGKTNEWDADEKQEPLLSETEILAMLADGASFGSHTETHAALTKVPLSSAEAELKGSRRSLEAILERPVTALCYPYAKQSEAIRNLAREAGYCAAVIGRGGVNKVRSDPFALRRIKVDTGTTIRSLRLRLAMGRLAI
ncbi:MAG: polysaccharide deacetylase family protein [Gemmatimonadota bacterium]|nr:polysaccharide deacetylase family protein [Gemmatimonadota bacterium]